MERPVLNGEDSVPLKFTISWVSLIQILNLLLYFQNQHFFQPSTDCRARREEPDPDNKHLVGDLDWVGFLFFFFLVLLILFFLSDDLTMFIYISQPFNTVSQVNHVMVRPLHALEWIRAQQYQCKALSWHRINSLQFDIKLTVWFLDSQHQGSYFIKNVFFPKSQNIRISPDRLWKPDILLYNSASADFYGAYQRFGLF